MLQGSWLLMTDLLRCLAVCLCDSSSLLEVQGRTEGEEARRVAFLPQMRKGLAGWQQLFDFSSTHCLFPLIFQNYEVMS